jgi:predicted secreted Zn-dependent protease
MGKKIYIFFCLSAPIFVGCASGFKGGEHSFYPGLSIITIDESYDIDGSTVKELHQSVQRNKPNYLEQSYIGEAFWRLRWNYNAVFEQGECKLDEINVELTITITVPRWQPAENTPAELVEKWQRFIAALKLHEEGHREIAMEASREIIRALKALRSFSCSSIQTEANRLARTIADKYSEKNRLYDIDTQHGITQGTVL